VAVTAPLSTTGSELVAGYHFTVIPHTHWDREWYLPFEVMRLRLARTVERICDVLEADERFRSFTLDGQAVILEDVVEVRPDLEPRLRRLIAEGRLITGPGYVLPDEFLSGQEALVRNLLHGRFVCERYGARPMPVGYLPDTFGHVAQIPQILRGFGLDSFIFWRGLGDDAARLGVAFDWRAPDGSSVTALRQLGSYGNANQLGRYEAGGVDLVDQPDRYPDAAAARFVRFVTTYAAELERTPTRALFLCNGSDHEGIHERLPELLEHARSVHGGMDAEIGSYEEYWDRLRPTLEAADLPVVRGELVGGRDAPVLRGINSTRMRLKQESERTERALLVAETLASLAFLRVGHRPPLSELRFGWREQLRNLPHDSISGCSIDQVHRDMLPRFGAARQVADRVMAESLAALAGGIRTWTVEPPAAEADVAIVNPLGWRRRVLAEIPRPGRLGDGAAATVDGRPTDVQFRGESALIALDVDAFGASEVRLVSAVSRAADRADGNGHDAANGKGNGHHIVASNIDVVSDPNEISNGIVAVAARPDGRIDVVDERTGRRYEGLHAFEDVADRGDEYTFCPVEGDAPIGAVGPAAARVIARGPVVHELELSVSLVLPRRLSSDRRTRTGEVRMLARTRIRLIAGSDRIEFTTRLTNRALDHRLRVLFPVATATDRSTVRAEGHFDVVERTVRPRWRGSGWTEPPALTSHTAGLVALDDVAIFGRGLPEYEAIPKADGRGVDLALTLLRCIGWLSRDDLATRPGGAGPTIATPEAQSLGPATFEYAIRVGVGDESAASLSRASADYRTPALIGPAAATGLGGDVEIKGDVVVTALKAAEDGDGAILRIANPGRVDVPFAISADYDIRTVHLDETELDAGVAGGIDAPLRAGEIRSFRLRRRTGG